jgi:hypothetical protein
LSGQAVATEKKGTAVVLLVALGALAVLPYLPVLSQPFISDDYLQIWLGRKYGPVSGWEALAQDALYRARAVSLVMTYWTERLFGFQPLPFYVSSILLHVVNSWLVFWLGLRLGLGRRGAAAAAAFFAVYEGHQEAVMWYAAVHELTVFAFVALALLAWMRFEACRRLIWLAAALGAFVLALLSKESAVAAVALLPLVARERRRMLAWVAPFAILAAVYTLAAFAAQSSHQHFNDGTFSLSAPFPLTLANSIGRLFWFWGLLALLVLAVGRRWTPWPLVLIAALWIVVTLLPYSFLTYMPRVPSRHTYLASAGLAWIVGLGWVVLASRLSTVSRMPLQALALAAVLHNCGYVWIKKRAQFLERAAPTEALVALARESRGPIHIRCFPYNDQLARLVVEMTVKDPPALVWEVGGGHPSEPCPSFHVHPGESPHPSPGARQSDPPAGPRFDTAT